MKRLTYCLAFALVLPLAAAEPAPMPTPPQVYIPQPTPVIPPTPPVQSIQCPLGDFIPLYVSKDLKARFKFSDTTIFCPPLKLAAGATHSGVLFSAVPQVPGNFTMATDGYILTAKANGTTILTVDANGDNGPVDLFVVSITVGTPTPPPPPANVPVISVTPQTVAVGKAFNYQITATNSPTAYTADPLPPGLSLSPSGVILGTPTTAGAYSVNVTASNASGTGKAVLPIIVSGSPDPPPPIPDAGLRVLMVYESADLSKMPAAQQVILYSKPVRDYLNAKCIMGPDSKTHDWRIWDRDVDTTNESALWQAAMKRPRSSVPWIVISDGKTGYEGPLPATVDETLALLKKYGG